MALLEIQNVSSGYGEVQILWDVSLRLERGKLTALVGSNGVGKTTLLRTVMGLLKASQGSILFRMSYGFLFRGACCRIHCHVDAVWWDPELSKLFCPSTTISNQRIKS